MPAETDPLLPDNESAPEIVGYGYSRKPNNSDYRSQPQSTEATDEGYKETESQGGADSSPLGTILTMFTVVVCFGLFLSLLISGKSGNSSKAPQVAPSKPSTSITTRVEKILSDHPLIGRPFSFRKTVGIVL